MATIVKGMFGIKVPYKAEAVAAIRTIEGRKWDVDNKVWWFRVEDLPNVAALLAPFYPAVSHRLLHSPRYEDARAHLKKSMAAVQSSYASSSDIVVPHPENMDYMPYQYAGVDFAYSLWRRKPNSGVLLADEMGLGKSVEFLGLVNKIRETKGYPLRTLIVCPASLKLNWAREATKWLLPKGPVVVMESGMPAATIKRHPVVIINYDILQKYLEPLYEIDWDIIGFDEAHFIKNKGTQRSKAARILGQNKGFCAMLSGTPIENRPNEIWHPLHIIDKDMWGSYSAFVARYFPSFGTFAGQGRPANQAELAKRLRSTYMIRRMKADVLTDLPPKVRQVVEISKNGFERVLKKEALVKAEYDKIEQEVDALELKVQEAKQANNTAHEEAYRADIAKIRSGTMGAIGEIAKVRHETALAKLPKCIEFIESVLEEKEKVVVFAHHRDVIEKVAEAFKGHSVVLYGGMSSSEKDASVQAFKTNPEIRVIVLSIAAGGVGLTLTEADTVVFCEQDWSPSKNEQAADRCHRIGQKNTVFAYFLVLEDSIDANIAKKCVAKQEMIDKTLNV